MVDPIVPPKQPVNIDPVPIPEPTPTPTPTPVVDPVPPSPPDPTPVPVVDPVPTPEPVPEPVPTQQESVLEKFFDEVKVVEEEVVKVTKKVKTKIIDEATAAEKAIVDDIQSVQGVGLSVLDYAEHVGYTDAIKLLQMVLGISKTGVIDSATRSAWAGAHGKREIIDDFNNQRKDNYKDLTDIRQASKDAV
jgi:hypothetical protein